MYVFFDHIRNQIKKSKHILLVTDKTASGSINFNNIKYLVQSIRIYEIIIKLIQYSCVKLTETCDIFQKATSHHNFL